MNRSDHQILLHRRAMTWPRFFATIVLGMLLAGATSSFAQFTDVTPGALLNPALANGVAWGDFDNDGDLDLAVANFSGSSNRIFRNDGDNAFVDVTAGDLLARNAHGVAWSDYDNDGDLDVYFVADGVDSLFRNDGGGLFVEVTGGPLGDTAISTGATWGDADNDGDVDLYLSSVGPNKLLRNDGSDVFVDATSGPLGDPGNPSIAVWGDHDNDGDVDLYLVIHNSPNKLLRNDGGLIFTDVTTGTIADPGFGASATWVDYDNDGDLDLYSANTVAQANHLYRNDGAGAFTDVTTGVLAGSSSTQGTAWADYDNDGDLDLFIANNGSNRLLRNDVGGGFTDITTGPLGDTRNSTGAAWGDSDGDGDLDLMVSTWGSSKTLLRNDLANGNHWLHVDLVGTVSNRSAIGARVTIIAGGVTQIREVSGGSGYFSQDSLTAEFGLGSTASVDTLQVRWPSGIVQTISNPAIDQRIVVVEPTTTAIRVSIDIKPNSPQNTINLGSAGVVGVAILSSGTFDPLTVDPDTISLAGASVKLIGHSDRFLCHEQDVNQDGFEDLVCNVLTVEFILEVGDSLAVLEASTFAGTSLRGEDSVRIVP